MRLHAAVLCALLIHGWNPVASMAAPPINEKVVADFYRPDEVQSIHLQVRDKDLKRMQAALPTIIDVPASFRWRDITVEKVSIRFKGNSSSNPNQTHKRSFLIKFDKYEKGQRFIGLRQASLDNGIQFGSLFSEPIITEILRAHGTRAHRCNHAKLYLNQKYQGVFVNVERVDESFIENHLPDPNGSLFKVDEGGPGCNLQFLGNDPSLYSKTFAAKNQSAQRDPARLVDFIKLINQADAKEFTKKLESRMELDDFLKVTAVMLLSGAFDQLTGWNPHNYFLYHDGNNDRWRYLPWDLDVGFCEKAFGKIQVHDDWNAAWPIPATGPPNPLLERIISDPLLLERYRQEARKILEKSFEPLRLCKVLDAKYQLIHDDLKADPFPHRRATVPGDKDYDGIVDSMKAFMRKRYISALQQLENPGVQPKVRHQPLGPPPHLIAKVQQIQKRAQEMQRDGQDISPIAKLMQRFGPAMQEGKLEEAEKITDEALKLIGQKDQ